MPQSLPAGALEPIGPGRGRPKALAGRSDADGLQCPPRMSRTTASQGAVAVFFAEGWRMTRQSLLLVVGGILGGLLAANHLPLRAQGDGKVQAEPGPTGPGVRTSVQEAL